VDQRVEWVNLRVTGVGPIPRPVIAEIADGPGDVSAPVSRSVHFGGWTEAAIIDRPQLGAGDIVTGPAIIQEFGSTVPVDPGYLATVDRYGNLIITRVDG